MRRKSAPKLRLNRETVLRLEDRELRTLAAGGTESCGCSEFTCAVRCTDFCTVYSICMISDCGCI